MAIAQAVLSTIGSTAVISLMSRIRARGTNEIEESLFTGLRLYLLNHFSTQLTIAIEEVDGLVHNELFRATKFYLATKIDPINCNRLKAYKSEKQTDITILMGIKEETVDSYNGVNLKWAWVCKKSEKREYHDRSSSQTRMHNMSGVQSFEVTFHKKHKDIVVDSYFPFILKQAEAQKQSKKTVRMFTTNDGRFHGQSKVWISIPLNHPATFDTLAMEPDMKAMLLKDLDMFVERGDKYKKVGKTWKRGYLLYGPPGTGKSSLVAAMANYLGFDVYDLELTNLMGDSELRPLLVSTINRSILLVEDIDCSVELHDRATDKDPPPAQNHKGHQERVTLSGFLNFIDGLWSSCGDERIIVFTTNRKEILDPALLRPGRMDIHIHMSYCTSAGFKLLASNYHGIEDHVLFKEIEKLIETIEVTPADAAKQLLKNDSTDIAMVELIKFLHIKKEENEKAKVKEAELEKDQEENEEPQHEDDIEKKKKKKDERMFEKAKFKKAKLEKDEEKNEEERNEEGIKKKKKEKMFVKAMSDVVSYWRCFGVCFLFLITWMVILGAAETNLLLVE